MALTDIPAAAHYINFLQSCFSEHTESKYLFKACFFVQLEKTHSDFHYQCAEQSHCSLIMCD